MADNTSHLPPFNRRSLLGLGSRALLAALIAQQAVGVGYASDEGAGRISRWVRELDVLSRRLARREITELQWQAAMDQLYGSAPMRSLLKLIDFDRLRQKLTEMNVDGSGEIFGDIPLGAIPEESEQVAQPDPTRRTAIVKVAHVKRGRSIPPHGHSSMVSAFLCISGEFDVRLYDRIEDLGEELVVRQTTNQKGATAGSWSSISDYRNNVHWLTARSDDCYLFTCKVIETEPARPFEGRINIDMHRAVSLAQGAWRAPKITHDRASEYY